MGSTSHCCISTNYCMFIVRITRILNWFGCRMVMSCTWFLFRFPVDWWHTQNSRWCYSYYSQFYGPCQDWVQSYWMYPVQQYWCSQNHFPTLHCLWVFLSLCSLCSVLHEAMDGTLFFISVWNLLGNNWELCQHRTCICMYQSCKLFQNRYQASNVRKPCCLLVLPPSDNSRAILPTQLRGQLYLYFYFLK